MHRYLFIQFQLLERSSVDDDLESMKKELSGSSTVVTFSSFRCFFTFVYHIAS